MKKSLLLILVVNTHFCITAQFVPNRSFEYGEDENDIEYWEKEGSIGEIKRVKYWLFRGDTIWPWTGEYMLLFENPEGKFNPNLKVSTTFACEKIVIRQFYFVFNSYYVDSMNDKISGELSRVRYTEFIESEIDRITVYPTNIWALPRYNVWLFNRLNINEVISDSCFLSFSFDPGRGFSQGSFALIDDLRLIGTPLSGTNNGDILESGAVGIFPNPFHDKVNIASFYRGACRITDNMGKQVFETEFRQSPLDLDLGHLAPGMYFIELTTGSGKRYTAKMLKQ